MVEPVLEMKHIYKRFPGIAVLEDVSFSARSGEVHVLLGANGAGKSTLMKIASGVAKCDSGEIFIRQKKVQIKSVKDARNVGIAMIYQELSLLKERTVYQNIFMGQELVKKGVSFLLDKKRMIEDSKRVLQLIGCDIDPREIVKNLSIAQQQTVEIAKAVWQKADILIMDEPTSSLTVQETEKLFALISRLKARGCCIIYISHKLEELFRVGDRITVLYQGRVSIEALMEDVDNERLIYGMTGRGMHNVQKQLYTPGEEVLRTNMLSGKKFRKCSISVRRREIVTLAGVVGSGRSELVKAIFGLETSREGSVSLFGKEMPKGHTPTYSIRHGMGFLPEDRRKQGLIMGMDVGKNIVQACLPMMFKNKILFRGVERDTAEIYAEEVFYNQGLYRFPEKLSGGNQQKIVLAKWLCTDCDLLIFDEPTKGIDAAARTEIYKLILELADGGKAVLMVSSDQSEVLRLSDRVYVMKEGRICDEIGRKELTAERIVSSEF